MLLSKLCTSLGLDFGGKDFDVSALATLKDASSSQIAYFDNPKLLDELKVTHAGAVFLHENFIHCLPDSTQAIVTPTPHLTMAYASAFFTCKPFDTSKEAIIAPSAKIASHVVIGSESVIAEHVHIMPNVTIGAHVMVGKNVTIYPGVVIYDHSIIKENCILHAGVVIGSDGFGYAHTQKGEHIKIHHTGNVIIEEDVEIGANSAIDRAVFGSTIIKKGTKIDNLVQVAHNCEVGPYTILAAQVGLAGTTKLGRNVVMGGQSASAGHLEIGDFAIIAGRGGVSRSIDGGKTYGGFPLMLQSEWLKNQAKISRFFKKH
jgi:UDP-3-O-[3-hydroxymyristoyl] glucosamine N-acyltransferase